MARQLVECEHCKGKKTCTRSGGRSCRMCLQASGRSIHQWGTVRCSVCGGIGRIWVDDEDSEEQASGASEQISGSDERKSDD
jgi:hypothetical protein